MQRVGGSVIGFSVATVSSASKGETIADTIRVVAAYADIASLPFPIISSNRYLKKRALNFPCASGLKM